MLCAMEPFGLTSILLLFGTCLLFMAIRRKTSERRRMPPGPFPLPLIGNFLQLDTKNFPRSLEKLSQKYGPVFTIYLGSMPAVVLYGHDVVMEALVAQGDEFAGRGASPILAKTTNGTGIGFSNGETWKQLRHFGETTLDMLGRGQNIEKKIQKEAGFLVERLKSTNGRTFDPTSLLSQTTTNILCSIAFGKRFNYEDKDFLRFLHLLNENANLQSSTMTKLYNIFPTILDYLPGSHQKIFKNTEEVKQFVSRQVDMHQKTLQPEHRRDFIDAFLIKMEQERQNSHSAFDLPGLVRSTLDLFTGGAQSTSLVLKYGLLVLMKYPKVHEKILQEIDSVIGPSQTPCMADLDKMPYTDAVIHEIHRCLALVPLNLPHAVIKDTFFRQYFIPKGTTVFPALKSSLYDSREFPNPEQFDVGHFLDKKGALRKSEFFIPFSTGKRVCLGKKLIDILIFIVLTTILQHITLKPLGGPDDLDTSPTAGFLTVAPKSYQLSVAPR
ncbi:cytochrome P450 2H1 isoform X1 [Pantherophis guttatus]|uniref:unspecific monooxygenase n=1 Tax=Pantherophis guttatus TaxID=94885 RepID=A0A6P9DC96_PANGU|nr:cytochrome P450 2H1 isoform X1 [Pantherophis guttatus]XP_034293418.1 cytochrome P450 2H1 isoform X1 [Pantherophis guttatus]